MHYLLLFACTLRQVPKLRCQIRVASFGLFRVNCYDIATCFSFGSATDPNHCHSFTEMGGKSKKSGPSGWAKLNDERRTKVFKETGSQVPPLKRFSKKQKHAHWKAVERPNPQTPPRKRSPKPEDIPTVLAPGPEDIIFQPVPGGRLLCTCCGRQGVVGWGDALPM